MGKLQRCKPSWREQFRKISKQGMISNVLCCLYWSRLRFGYPRRPNPGPCWLYLSLLICRTARWVLLHRQWDSLGWGLTYLSKRVPCFFCRLLPRTRGWAGPELRWTRLWWYAVNIKVDSHPYSKRHVSRKYSKSLLWGRWTGDGRESLLYMLLNDRGIMLIKAVDARDAANV